MCECGDLIMGGSEEGVWKKRRGRERDRERERERGRERGREGEREREMTN